jgi:exodeoxyribonuclease V alpha subunit
MLARNLLYTGVTRGKKLVVLVAQRKAIGIAVRGGSMKRRWTKLKEWMAEAVPIRTASVHAVGVGKDHRTRCAA